MADLAVAAGLLVWLTGWEMVLRKLFMSNALSSVSQLSTWIKWYSAQQKKNHYFRVSHCRVYALITYLSIRNRHSTGLHWYYQLKNGNWSKKYSLWTSESWIMNNSCIYSFVFTDCFILVKLAADPGFIPEMHQEYILDRTPVPLRSPCTHVFTSRSRHPWVNLQRNEKSMNYIRDPAKEKYCKNI